MHDPHYAYRPDIDGMRAIAVLAVVVFHAFPEALPGGFVGVDIFFVISGFLITSILQREIADGSNSIARFYVRRIRRLFPALALVLATTLIIGWAILLRDEFQQLGKHAAAGAAFVSNIALWLEAGYFERESELKPLLHLWSLGVEEQFYFIWPLILALAVRARVNLVVLAAAIGVASFAANLSLVERDPISTFFLPFTRFWELMVGGLLATATFTLARQGDRRKFLVSGRTREAAAVFGLGLILFSLIAINENRPFPGTWALLPTAGAALLIATGPSTWVARHLLSRRVAVYIGLISYPLYLWHWPLFSFARIIEAGLPPLSVRLIIFAVSVGLASATYHFVELPLRTASRREAGARRAVTSLGMVMVAVCVTGLLVSHGYPRERLTSFSEEISAARADWHYPGDKQAGINGTMPGTVLFLGDSYIQQLYPRVQALRESQAHFRSVVFNTSAGCAPVPGVGRKSMPGCASFIEGGLRVAHRADVEVVVVAGSWLGLRSRGDYFRLDDPEESIIDLQDPQVLDDVLADLGAVLKELVMLGKQVFVILNPPGGRMADPESIREIRLGTADQTLPVRSIRMQEHLDRTGDVNARLQALAKRAGAEIIDPAAWICDSQACHVTDELGVPRYRDATHFRASFVRQSVSDFDGMIVPGSGT